MAIPYDALWSYVSAEFKQPFSIHGPTHWQRVERNGLVLADSLPNVDRDVVRLFALFHDAKRINEGHDPGHGERGALYAASLIGKEFGGVAFSLESHQLEWLVEACSLHTDQLHHSNDTIGCCFDADRLDLPRVAIQTESKYLNIDLAKTIADTGGMDAWLNRAEKG